MKHTTGRKRGRPLKFNDQCKEKYLTALRSKARGIIGIAAGIAGVDTETVRVHRENNPAFAAREKAAREAFADEVEQEFLRRAIEGIPKAVFHQGERCDNGEVREFSDALLLAALRRHKPEYREKQSVDHTMTGGIVFIGSKPTAGEWESDGDSKSGSDKP